MSLSILYDGPFLINSTTLPFIHMQNRNHKRPIRNKINIPQQLLVQSPNNNISFKSIRYETRDRKGQARTSWKESAWSTVSPVRSDLHTKFITEIYQLVNISLWMWGKCHTSLTKAALILHPHISYYGKRSTDTRQRDTQNLLLLPRSFPVKITILNHKSAWGSESSKQN
jgi:hypothetical protein